MLPKLAPYIFNVDIVGTCNLRCPSCPIGNTNHAMLPRGAMPIELLDAIVKKAKRDHGWVSFHLYNWTEPLIHPRIGDAIETVLKNGVACHLSTNLNLDKQIAAVANAAPTSIRVSVSAFTQDRYGATHKGGSIEKVKENMEKLAGLVRHNGGLTELNLLYHRYLGNHEEEAQMRTFAEALGYNFDAVWAYLMPLEKNIAFAVDGPDAPSLSCADRELISSLALPLDKAIEVSKHKRTSDCTLRSNQYTLDSEGNVSLCCAVYDSDDRVIGNYLDTPHQTLLKRKYEHPLCNTCMKHGLHVLATYGAAEEFDRIATENVIEHYPSAQFEASLAVKRKSLVGKLRVAIARYSRMRARVKRIRLPAQ